MKVRSTRVADVVSLREAVAELVRDGNSVALGGSRTSSPPQGRTRLSARTART